MKVSELITILSHHDPNLQLHNIKELLEQLAGDGDMPLPQPSGVTGDAEMQVGGDRPLSPLAADFQVKEYEGRNVFISDLPPLQLDNHPRYTTFAAAPDPSESILWEALRLLREAVLARGYNNRPVEFADCVLVASTRWARIATELAEKFPGLKVQLVNPMVLKTECAWALVCGYDSIISLCVW